jgi:prephenate dehydrogenase
MADILLTNRAHILPLLQSAVARLRQLEAFLSAADETALQRLLQIGRTKRQALLQGRS